MTLHPSPRLTFPLFVQLSLVIFFLSGCSKPTDGDATVSEIWSTLTTKLLGPALLGRGVALMLSGDILLVGGAQYSDHYSSYAQIFSPATSSYNATAPLPEALYNSQAETLPSGKVLVFGGFGYGRYSSDSYIYDPRQSTWSEAAPLPLPLQSHASAHLRDGRVISFGGHNGVAVTTTAITYSERTNEWNLVNSLPIPLMYAAASLLADGRVMIVGGSDVDKESGTIRYSKKAFIYDPIKDEYEVIDDVPVAMRGGFLEAFSNGSAIYGGGEISATRYSNRTYFFCGGQWRVGGALPDPRAFADSVKISADVILLFGGNADPYGQIDSVLRLDNGGQQCGELLTDDANDRFDDRGSSLLTGDSGIH